MLNMSLISSAVQESRRAPQPLCQLFNIPKIPSDITDDVTRSGQVHLVRTFPLMRIVTPVSIRFRYMLSSSAPNLYPSIHENKPTRH
jgi:hypothetical protein